MIVFASLYVSSDIPSLFKIYWFRAFRFFALLFKLFWIIKNLVYVNNLHIRKALKN